MDATDKCLIDAHLAGDESAFAELVGRYGDGMLGYLTKICNNRSQAEDFFQETFKRVHQSASTFRGGNFKSWIYTIATRVALDSFRRQKRLKFVSLNGVFSGFNENSAPSECVDGNCPAPYENAERDELKASVRKALNVLPDKQRTALVLAYYEQLSYKQVAEVMGCSVGSVKTQMFRALKKLAAQLPEYSGGVI